MTILFPPFRNLVLKGKQISASDAFHAIITGEVIMNKNNITRMALSIVFFCFLLSTFVSLWSLQIMIQQNMQELSKSLAAQIYDTIIGELSEPIAVSKAMANDRFILGILENDDPAKKEETESLITEYLTGLHEAFSYDSAFIISDASGDYFTYNGLAKTMHPDSDERDQWYPLFVSRDLTYEVDVDRDEAHSDVLTFFVNARMQDSGGKLLGVCGVGIDMTRTQNLIFELEKEYGVKINLIDKNGLIQSDSDSSMIENASITGIPLHENDEYVYEGYRWGKYAVTRYIDRIGWYLVVRNESSAQMYRFFNMIFLNLILCLLVMVILVFAIRIVVDRTAALTHASFRDQGTLLFNRRAFEEEKARLAESGLDENFVYVTADLNGLKAVNDTLGHTAGDELIRGAAVCLENCLGPYGSIYRIGGDEFAATLTITAEQLSEALDRLEKQSAAWSGEKVKGVSLSIGHASGKEFPSENITEIMKISDERMYAAKEEYYRRTGKDRRKG